VSWKQSQIRGNRLILNRIASYSYVQESKATIVGSG